MNKTHIIDWFQFHKGSIKTFGIPKAIIGFSCFNSIKVRLRQDGCYVHQIETRLFQFHKGSIKTLLSYQAIEGLSCFNSIKVRLRHECVEVVDSVTQFQFHKGSIKTHSADVDDSELYVSIP